MTNSTPAKVSTPGLIVDRRLQKARGDFAQGRGTDLFQFIAASEGRNVTYMDQVRIAAFEQYVTIDRFFMGIFSGMLLGIGIITIVYAAIGGLNIDLTPSYLNGDGGALIGFLLLGVSFGNLFSWNFNKRATQCPHAYEDARRKDKDGNPLVNPYATRQGETCLSDSQCTTLDEERGRISGHDQFYYISGRCIPRPPPPRIRFTRRAIAGLCFGISIVFFAIHGNTITKINAASIIAATMTGIFIGWIMGFILS